MEFVDKTEESERLSKAIAGDNTSFVVVQPEKTVIDYCRS
jgi:hypothetical protein